MNFGFEYTCFKIWSELIIKFYTTVFIYLNYVITDIG